MSTKVTAWVFHSDETKALKGNRFTAMIALADIADDDGNVIFAKRGEGNQAALAAKARQSVPTFRRVTRELVEDGLLEVTRASATSENSYRILMPSESTTAQSDLWITPESTAQNERSHRSPGERSHRSTVSGHKNVFNVVTKNPLTPAERGNHIHPNDEVLALLNGAPLATRRNRVCTAHDRQRRTCFDCWRIRPLAIAEVPWCGDRECDPHFRRRLIVNSAGLEVMTVCPECHPKGIPADRAAELLEAIR